MPKSKVSTQDAMKWFFQQDIWQQRLIARQACLKMYDELALDMPDHADSLARAKQLQRDAIRACKNQDQVAWDAAEAEHKSVMDAIKETV